MEGRSSHKGQEKIVNESHRHVTRNGEGRRGICMEERKVNVKNEKIKRTEDTKNHLTQPTTLETSHVPQISGPITQTSPDTERGGSQDKVRKTIQTQSQEKANKPRTHLL